MRNSQLCNIFSQIDWPNVLTSIYAKVNWLLGNPVLQVHFKSAVGSAILESYSSLADVLYNLVYTFLGEMLFIKICEIYISFLIRKFYFRSSYHTRKYG